MKITAFDITHLKRGRSLLQIRTDAGITGLSEADGQIFEAHLESTIEPLLIGEDPRQIDRHWETLYLGSQKQIPRESKLRPQIVGAVDIALWDILGKDAGLPCHALMGGAARIDIPLYWSVGSGWKKTPEQMLDDVKVGWEEGYKSYKIRMDWKSYRQDANPANDLAIFKLVRDFLPTTSTSVSMPTTATPSPPPSNRAEPSKLTDASTTSKSRSPSTTSPDFAKLPTRWT